MSVIIPIPQRQHMEGDGLFTGEWRGAKFDIAWSVFDEIFLALGMDPFDGATAIMKIYTEAMKTERMLQRDRQLELDFMDAQNIWLNERLEEELEAEERKRALQAQIDAAVSTEKSEGCNKAEKLSEK